MKTYKNQNEINADLARLNLERKIAWEEIKGLRYQLEEDLQPYNWMKTAISVTKKYGLLYLVRKILK
ncbi:hypothetical protein [Aurantibacter sp.]|uniref:hypothetical protein n=1 Tax=Aurantibacter sp. TaxID=2807103 RepID=UPI003264346C